MSVSVSSCHAPSARITSVSSYHAGSYEHLTSSEMKQASPPIVRACVRARACLLACVRACVLAFVRLCVRVQMEGARGLGPLGMVEQPFQFLFPWVNHTPLHVCWPLYMIVSLHVWVAKDASSVCTRELPLNQLSTCSSSPPALPLHLPFPWVMSYRVAPAVQRRACDAKWSHSAWPLQRSAFAAIYTAWQR